jgi:PAS domain S-box-containing protein
MTTQQQFERELERQTALHITTQRHVERELERQTAHLDELFELSPDAVVLTALNPPRTIRVNKEFTRIFGYTSEEAVGRRLRELIVPEGQEPANLTRNPALLQGKKVEQEVIRRRKDGTLFHAQVTAARVRLHGFEDGAYVIYRDISERKRAELLLAGEKRLLEMVASGVPLLTVLDSLCRFFEEIATDCTCSVILVDPTGTYLLQGASPSLPPKFTESIDGRPVSVDNGPCAMAACLNEQVISADIAKETRWGAYRWPELALSFGFRACWSTPITSSSGKVVGTFGLHYDKPASPTSLHQNLIEQFTHLASIAIERAQSDAALKRSEAFLAQGQHLSHTGSFSWRAATKELVWSDEVYCIYGLDPAVPLTTKLIRSRIHPEDLPFMREQAARTRTGDVLDYDYEHRLQMPDGSIKYLRTVARGTRNQDGSLEYIGAVQDVTERRLSEQALGKLRAELAHVARVTSMSALTASIAHEVNQPLSGIITNASTCLRMLAADPPNVDGARETARRIIRDGNRASDVITRLRALFVKKDPTTEPVDLNEATREVIALSLNELERGRVVLRAEFAEDLRPVIGDRVQLQQVMINLLLNALDAMSEVDDRPRQLVIRTESDEGDRVRLTVQDVGTGIDSQRVERLFDPFYTTKTGGMGIGLSVSRSIIESHHGRLWAAPNDGPGATFSFSLPCRAEVAAGGYGVTRQGTMAGPSHAIGPA